MKLPAAAALAVMLVAAPGTAQETLPNPAPPPAGAGPEAETGATAAAAIGTASFVARAASLNLFEVMAGRLALERGMSGDVIAFAKGTMNDHGQATEALRAAAAEADLAPGDPELVPVHREMLDNLSDFGGKEFEAEYLRRQLYVHQEAIDLFRRYAFAGGEQPIVDYAERMLPLLLQHYEDGSDLARKR